MYKQWYTVNIFSAVLLRQLLHDRCMCQDLRRSAAEEVNVFIAVQISDNRAFTAFYNKWEVRKVLCWSHYLLISLYP